MTLLLCYFDIQCPNNQNEHLNVQALFKMEYERLSKCWDELYIPPESDRFLMVLDRKCCLEKNKKMKAPPTPTPIFRNSAHPSLSSFFVQVSGNQILSDNVKPGLKLTL